MTVSDGDPLPARHELCHVPEKDPELKSLSGELSLVRMAASLNETEVLHF
jgi:hypothetical protein